MITVIVPVYNVEQYLPRCLDSIINQTYKDLEILLIDDGSNDGSGRICDEYAERDSRIIVFHKSNGGVSSARNVGLKQASGNYICFVDSDDIIHPRCIEILHSVIMATNVDIAISGFIKTNDPAMVFGEIEEPIQIRTVRYSDFIVNSISNHNNVVAKLYRIDVLKNHLFDEEIVYGEDAVFNFSLIYGKKNLHMVRVNQSLYYYINRDSSAINTLSRDLALGEVEWYLKHWDIFLKENEWMVCEHAIKTILQIRMELFLTPSYDNMMESWTFLSDSLITKLKHVGGMPFTHKIKYYSFLKCFQLYRFLLILNDTTIKEYEKKKKLSFC
jgi:glycosyltransferase involved in cell wall biosynthesis